MTRRRTERFPQVHLPLVALLSLVMAACPAPTPHQPGDDAGSGGPLPDAGEPGPVELERHTIRVGLEEQTFSFADGTWLWIPAFAVDEPVDMIASRWEVEDDATGETRIHYLFEPEGLVFVRPLVISASTRGATEAEFEWRSVDGFFKSHGGGVAPSGVKGEMIRTGEARVTTRLHQTRTVSGVVLSTHVAPDGTRTSTPDPAFGGTVTIVKPPNEFGNVGVSETSIGPDGTFAFRGVPRGTYMLRGALPTTEEDPGWFAFERSVLDLGVTTSRRPDVEVASEGTALALRLTGDPVLSQPRPELFSSNAGVWLENVSPPMGSASYDLVSRLGHPPFLVDTSRGDDVRVFNRAVIETNDSTYRVLTHTAAPGSLVQTDGVRNDLTADLTELARDVPYARTLYLTQFVNELEAGTPGLVVTHAESSLEVEPLAPDRSAGRSPGRLPLLHFLVPPERGPWVHLVADYALPAGLQGEPVTRAHIYGEVPRQLSGTHHPVHFELSHIQEIPLATPNDGFQTILEPIIELRIDGRDAMVDQVDVSPDAHLEWTHDVYPPNRYRVTLWQLFREREEEGTGPIWTRRRFVTSVVTEQAGVRFPTNSLKHDRAYVVQVQSLITHNPLYAPRRPSHFYSAIEVLSAVFTIESPPENPDP